MDEKIVPFEEVSSRIAKLRAAKPDSVVVLCHGCFDIVHPGHIRHLRFAREQGSLLIVSITPDVCIQKGSNRPLMPQALRAENLAAFEIVDFVTIAPGDTGLEPIEAIRPNIYVKGSEYAVSNDPRFHKEKALVERQGGSVVYSSGEVVFSSSAIIRERDMNLALNEKLNYICQRYSIGRKLLLSSLDSAPKLSIVLTGEAILDERMQCEGLGMAQDAPVLSLALKHKSLAVGGSGAIALHLAAMGINVRFLTSVRPEGQPFSAFKLAMEEGGVELVNVEDRVRQLCVRSHILAGRSKVLELESAGYRQLDSNMRATLLRKFRELLKDGASCALLADYGYGLLSDDLAKAMLSVAKGRGAESLSGISMTQRTNLEKFSQSEIFGASEPELRSCMHDYESGLSVLVDRFYRTHEVKHIFLLLSDGGALFFRRPERYGNNMESIHIPQLAAFGESRSGLQEAFLAGLAYARAAKLTPEQSTYMSALFIAAFSSAPPSAAALDPERIRHLIDERKELL